MSNLQPGELLTHNRCNKSTGCGPTGCGQAIAYRTMRSGAKIAIDPVPVAAGNIALIGESDGAEGIAEELAADRCDAYEGHLYATHLSTCKDGDQFRKNRAPRTAYPAGKGIEATRQRMVEDQIKAHVAWFVREAQDRNLKTRTEIGEMFSEQQRGWWKDERDRAVRRIWILRVRAAVLEKMGFSEAAA